MNTIVSEDAYPHSASEVLPKLIALYAMLTGATDVTAFRVVMSTSIFPGAKGGVTHRVNLFLELQGKMLAQQAAPTLDEAASALLRQACDSAKAHATKLIAALDKTSLAMGDASLGWSTDDGAGSASSEEVRP
jgi:hypothetical protein